MEERRTRWESVVCGLSKSFFLARTAIWNVPATSALKDERGLPTSPCEGGTPGGSYYGKPGTNSKRIRPLRRFAPFRPESSVPLAAQKGRWTRLHPHFSASVAQPRADERCRATLDLNDQIAIAEASSAASAPKTRTLTRLCRLACRTASGTIQIGGMKWSMLKRLTYLPAMPEGVHD